jgi:hypothetical protein
LKKAIKSVKEKEKEINKLRTEMAQMIKESSEK